MKRVILLAALAFSTIGFSQTMGRYSQEPTSIYGTIKNRTPNEIIKLTHPTPEVAINKYGKQLRSGYAFQCVGLSIASVGVFVLFNDDKKDVAYALGAAGLLSTLIGQVIIWDSSKHLRVSTNGLNLKVQIK